MLYMFMVAVFVSFFAVFFLLLAYKWQIVDWLQRKGSEKVSEMAHCDFCMSWWLSVLLTIIIAPFIGEWWLVCVPFIAAPLARHWL